MVNPSGFTSLLKLPLRLQVLLALVLQTTMQAMLLGYSRNVRKEKYNASSAILLQELFKIVASLYLMSKRDPATLYGLVKTSLPMSVPAIIYYVQNSLVYVALQHLKPQEYSTLIQLKLLSAALVSIVLLKKTYSTNKWRALVILTMGAILVQAKHFLCKDAKEKLEDDNPLFGVLVTVLISFLSSFAGVYTERVLKGKPAVASTLTEADALWAANFQLGLYSCGFSAVDCFFNGTLSGGFFTGYSWLAMVIIVSEAARGLTVALVLKNADTVLKGFATSCAIVVTTVCSFVFLGHSVDLLFAIGAGMIITSIFVYNEK